jgi:hypothetical protein
VGDKKIIAAEDRVDPPDDNHIEIESNEDVKNGSRLRPVIFHNRHVDRRRYDATMANHRLKKPEVWESVDSNVRCQ